MSADVPEKPKSVEEKKINQLPMVKAWETTYGKSCDGNDEKAARLFKEFESAEKLTRLRNELFQLRDGKVADQTALAVVGMRRIGRHTSAANWANLMIIWLNKRV